MMKISYRMTKKGYRKFPHILRHQSEGQERVNVMVADKKLWHAYKLIILFSRCSEYRRKHDYRL